MKKQISLFVPGRLCLFGEHSDWAGMHRMVNSEVPTGAAIVTGIEQGIYATAERADRFLLTSDLDFYKGQSLDCEMDTEKLLAVARQGGFFSYVAGVASYINDNYSVGGVHIHVTDMTLPIKSGLSSSAAICVLVARAFNQLYQLRMNTKGEMQVAFRGEQRTPSRCGRLDQACAYGVRPVLMEFDGSEVESRGLTVGNTFYFCIADLCGEKDTVRILGDLNKCYPFAETEKEKRVQEALGRDNQEIVAEARRLLTEGDAESLGALMDRAQENFDKKVAPACAEELTSPILHSVMHDEKIRQWIYGVKGVGSQGDGTVQFLAKDEESLRSLIDYLDKERGMPAFSLTLKPGRKVKKAIIPLAGFGTRLYPASKMVKKAFLPLVDTDGMMKPALLILLEQLEEAGIEEIALVIGREEEAFYEQFFTPLGEENRSKLNEDARALEQKLVEYRKKIRFIFQEGRHGFGHAVYQCRAFTEGDPVLLLLGDMVYRTGEDRNCMRQLMDAFENSGKTMVSIHPVPLDDVVHYGILSGYWEDQEERVLHVDTMVEKPTDDYAREYLAVVNAKKQKEFYAVFGQYILTGEVFEALEENIREDRRSGGEIQLTDALEMVRDRTGLAAYRLNGRSFDLGLPDSYLETVASFSRRESAGR
ncbi:MAG: hypothetical protein K6G16_07490 [Lachnospiraceae bacterium]|nr:hypothetical protein [Lachnospiraceae bacterium]